MSPHSVLFTRSLKTLDQHVSTIYVDYRKYRIYKHTNLFKANIAYKSAEIEECSRIYISSVTTVISHSVFFFSIVLIRPNIPSKVRLVTK